ncbi:HAD family phosphatase [Streptomyces sp. YIM 98790]|uniref:HAD family hydrolase n=1 Tax=Streptomyces sp. YIM 98790 TaxID=2689077 RepID=UPI0014096684|nr:HAD family phosphatase [Streptomyces sp. YIM 98790]
MLLADRLVLRDGTTALLFDMDGVLLDTLALDLELAERLLKPVVPHEFTLTPGIVRANFPYDIPEFWRRTAAAVGHRLSEEETARLTAELNRCREAEAAPVHEGIVEILKDARSAGLRIALVSNNPREQIDAMTAATGLAEFFDAVVSNDIEGVRKKPAPDPYLEAARLLGAEPARCAAVEDSLLGAESAAAAGCFTVGVATGACDFRTLSASPHVDVCYSGFQEARVRLGNGRVTEKFLVTPNEFVSHMIEHIAWRTGRSVDVRYTSDDWRRLGELLGKELRALPRRRTASVSLGMIDDGSCEVVLRDAAGQADGRSGRFTLTSSQQVDLDWFVGVRCEQMADGRPLLAMLHGLADGGALDIDINVTSFEDPHHTWEAVFRGVGIAAEKLGHPEGEAPWETAVTGAAEEQPPAAAAGGDAQAAAQPAARSVEKGWTTLHSSVTRAATQRETAESVVRVEAELGGSGVDWKVDVADSIEVDGMRELLREFARGAGMRLDVTFRATRLNSSHVVTEDIGMVLGRTLRQIALERMERIGIYGAGSSLRGVEDLDAEPVHVGVSMEGRKFCKYVPLAEEYDAFRKRFLIGSTLADGMFSEDLDDFVDGFAGGMQASVIAHFGTSATVEEGWPMVFRGMGEAVRELMSVNESRRRLIAGVKGTLA